MSLGQYNFPRQKLPRSKKTDKWAHCTIDDIIKMSDTTTDGSLGTGGVRMKVNYDLYNGIVNQSDFTYVTNPYGLDKEYPARFAHYDVISPKINLLLGEEIKRPFNYRVVCTDSESTGRLEEKQKQLLFDWAHTEFMQELQANGHPVDEQAEQQFQSLPDIKKYMQYSFQDMAEYTAQKSLEYLVPEQNLQYKFNKGWKDALIAGREIYWVGIQNGEPTVEVVNPLEFDCDKDPDMDFYEDGQWATQTKWCTTSSIIDMYYRELSSNDIKKLEGNGNAAPPSIPDTDVFGNTINLGDQGELNSPSIMPIGTPFGIEEGFRNENGYIKVVRVEWKSMRKIGFLTFIDEKGVPQETIVDESYKPLDEQGQKVEWVWINEVWEGTKIGSDIYVNVRPKLNQFRSVDNPSRCKLGFVGIAYNNRNSQVTSLVDIVKPHQYLYNIIMYRLELEIAKAKGKKMVMDLAQIPRSMGIDMDKWMYYFDTVGIAFVNSFEEGTGRFQGQQPGFNQFTDIDMTLSQSIGQYLIILQKLEDMIGELSGVSRQRQGSISSSETVGGVERAVAQSSHITEKLFYEHSETKKRVLTSLLEVAKVAWEDGKKVQYVLPDMSRKFLDISGDDFPYSDYGVFISNSAKDDKIKADLTALAQAAMSSGIVKFSDIVEIIKSDSIAEISNKIKQSEAEMDAIRQQESSYSADKQAEMQQQMLALEKDKLDREDMNKQLDRENKIEVAQIGAMGFDTDHDIDDNGVPDVLELEKLRQSQKESDRDFSLKKDELAFKKDKQKQDAALKEKALKKKPTSSK